MYRTF